MRRNENPFAELIEVLKHNGYARAKLTVVPGIHFFNLLKKGGWDQGYSGKGKTHILMRLREPSRGPACGINTLIDLARALESGHRAGLNEWVTWKYGAKFIVNFQRKWFITFIPL
jgi:hypothetical protein